MILAAIAGGASGILVFLATHAGLVATPSPGSIFAYAAETPRGGWFGVFAGVIIAAGVSFAVGSMLLGFGRPAEKEAREQEEAAAAERAEQEEAAGSGRQPARQPAVTTPTPARRTATEV